MPHKGKRSHHPPKWVIAAYKVLAAGRYAVEWLPEFLDLYAQVADEEGDDAALAWAKRELLLSLKPGIASRTLWILRMALAIWKAYRAVFD